MPPINMVHYTSPLTSTDSASAHTELSSAAADINSNGGGAICSGKTGLDAKHFLFNYMCTSMPVSIYFEHFEIYKYIFKRPVFIVFSLYYLLIDAKNFKAYCLMPYAILLLPLYFENIFLYLLLVSLQKPTIMVLAWSHFGQIYWSHL